ncbi:MAG: hypothetical protein RJA20_1228, partial [Bacteroidota bacterium]
PPRLSRPQVDGLPIRQAVEQGSWVRAIEAIAGAGSRSGSDATAKGDGGNGECGWGG